MLRQNPHNVHEWHKRVKLFDGQPERQIKVYAEAVATVDPDKVGLCGQLASLAHSLALAHNRLPISWRMGYAFCRERLCSIPGGLSFPVLEVFAWQGNNAIFL